MQSKTPLKIVRVPVPSPTLWPHTTTDCYLIGNEHESILIDTGYDQKETRNLLEKVIVDEKFAIPKRIFLSHSHPDHSTGVRQLMAWSPVVSCHRKESRNVLAAISPFKNISFLDDKEIITVSGEEIIIIHGPGHTAGHLCFYIPTMETLIAGDNIVAEGTTWIGGPDGDMTDYLRTLRQLRNLKLQRIGPGHGDWILNPYEHIDFVINRRLHREKQIRKFLIKHLQLSSKRLTEMIYGDSIHPSLFEVAKLTTEAHLNKLIQEGSVTLYNSVYSIRLNDS